MKLAKARRLARAWIDLLEGEAHFDAHPEPKPWHEAKPGEVWIIATEDVGQRPYIVTDYGTFDEPTFEHSINDPLIVSGRRIWHQERP